MDKTPKTDLLTHMQLVLHQVPSPVLDAFSKALFPVLKNAPPIENLLSAIQTYIIIQINKKVSFQATLDEITLKAKQHSQLNQKMKLLFTADFSQQLKSQVMSSRDIGRFQSQKEKQEMTTQIVDVQTFTPVPSKSTKDSSNKSGRKKTNNSVDNRKQQAKIGQIDIVSNLANKGVCVCQKPIGKDQIVFNCQSCGRTYHCQCMKRKTTITYCAYCHLTNMLPNRQTKKVLFMGMLRKGRKKHEFSFNLSQEDIAMRCKLQVRCFRLKQAAKNIIQFPDAASLNINNYCVHQCQPLHRQSSLKHRKDQPFYIQSKHLNPKQNKVVVVERHPSKQHKDQRIQLENHLIGFFLVEQKKVQPLVKQISLNFVTSFEQSKKLLDAAFNLGGGLGAQEVSCQVVKIPLTCTLTTQKIKIPVRGSFCKHYQCFDLSNYVMMISQSANPRWMCPICKVPCYSFQVDLILSALISQYSRHGATQIMFFKNGQFSVHAGQQVLQQNTTKTIFDLPIEGIGKRGPETIVEPQKKKKRVSIPEGTNVISLDQ